MGFSFRNYGVRVSIGACKGRYSIDRRRRTRAEHADYRTVAQHATRKYDLRAFKPINLYNSMGTTSVNICRNARKRHRLRTVQRPDPNPEILTRRRVVLRRESRELKRLRRSAAGRPCFSHRTHPA